MKKLKSIGTKIAPFMLIAILFVLWESIVQIKAVPKYILPSPSEIFTAMIKDAPILKGHIYTTLYEALFGFLISIILSLVISIIMDSFNIVKRSLYPILVISQTVPIIALAPLFIIWFGFGTLPKIIVVVLVCFFPMVISLVDGFSSVDEDMINHFKLMGASKAQTFLHLKFPYGMISFFSGMKIAATYSITGAIIGEWLGGEKGLGVYMVRAKNAYALDKVFAAIVIIVILSIIIVSLISRVEKLSTQWKD